MRRRANSHNRSSFGQRPKRLGGKRLISALALVALASISSADAAEKILKFRLVTYAVNVSVVPATATEGHVLGSGEMRGVAVFEDGRLADKAYTVAFDYTNGAGPFHGYATYTFEDGSSISARFDGKSVPGDSGRIISGDYTELVGTGDFEGVDGRGTFTSRPAALGKGATLYDGSFTLKMPQAQ